MQDMICLNFFKKFYLSTASRCNGYSFEGQSCPVQLSLASSYRH